MMKKSQDWHRAAGWEISKAQLDREMKALAAACRKARRMVKERQ
jgi:hypothetical protein